jgi:hypothetical protein
VLGELVEWIAVGRQMHGRGRSGRRYVVSPVVLRSWRGKPTVTWDLDGSHYVSTGEAMEAADRFERDFAEPSRARA